MTKNLEKIDVFWDLDLERILGRFWVGFGRGKARKGEERREKEREERDHQLRLPGIESASWVSLGRFLGTLGRLLANLKRLSGASWLLGPPRTSIFTDSETCRAGFWRASGTCLGMPFATPRAS